jgi:hypothetical protein
MILKIKAKQPNTQPCRLLKKPCINGISSVNERIEHAVIISVLEYHGFFRSVSNGEANVDMNDRLVVNDWVTIKQRGPNFE